MENSEKQEPVAWSRLDTARSVITEREEIKRGWELDGLPFKGLFDTPQPCPECEERKTTALNYISLTFEFEQLQSKCEKLRADADRVYAMQKQCDILAKQNTDLGMENEKLKAVRDDLSNSILNRVRAETAERCAGMCEELIEAYRGTNMGKCAEVIGDNCATSLRALACCYMEAGE